MFVFLRTPWVETSVVFWAVVGRAVVGRTGDWRSIWLEIAFLTELLEAVVWKGAVGIKTGVRVGGEFVILGHLQGGSPPLR
jgi:hypothetical protein